MSALPVGWVKVDISRLFEILLQPMNFCQKYRSETPF